MTLFSTACKPPEDQPFCVTYKVVAYCAETHLTTIGYTDSTGLVFVTVPDTVWTKSVQLPKDECASLLALPLLTSYQTHTEKWEDEFLREDKNTFVSVLIAHKETVIVDSGPKIAITAMFGSIENK